MRRVKIFFNTIRNRLNHDDTLLLLRKQKAGNKTQNALLPVMVSVFVNKYDLAYSKDATLPLGKR